MSGSVGRKWCCTGYISLPMLVGHGDCQILRSYTPTAEQNTNTDYCTIQPTCISVYPILSSDNWILLVERICRVVLPLITHLAKQCIR